MDRNPNLYDIPIQLYSGMPKISNTLLVKPDEPLGDIPKNKHHGLSEVRNGFVVSYYVGSNFVGYVFIYPKNLEDSNSLIVIEQYVADSHLGRNVAKHLQKIERVFDGGEFTLLPSGKTLINKYIQTMYDYSSLYLTHLVDSKTGINKKEGEDD